jgi:non-specific serine/threonine protein kinase
MPVSAAPAPAAARAHPTRAFGRFELRALLGRSERTMLWLAYDRRVGQEMLLTMPRVAPADAAGLERWIAQARHASRLDHPHLAHVVEVGAHEAWPYVLCDRVLGSTLGERLAGTTAPPAHAESVGWLCQALEGLAFAHDAGVAHHDLQLHSLLIDDAGHVRVMALAAGSTAVAAAPGGAAARAMALDPGALRAQRDAAERDLLAVGVLAHQLVGGVLPLDEADAGRVVAQLPPQGHARLALSWSAQRPVSDALRAIVNRTTDGQLARRYHNARTLLRALVGWRDADAQERGGPAAVLLDRLHAVGHLPAMPGLGSIVVRLARMERERTNEMAEQILLDIGLSVELLRQVHSAEVQGTQAAGNAPVLTIRRAIAMVGLDGVRRAATALRPWPGPLSEAGAAALLRTLRRVRLAGHLAQLLRPRGYDPEVVFLIAVLQNIGRLAAQYHFADDAEQIWQLMRPVQPVEPDAPEQPGLSEDGAAYAVLGTDIATLAAVVARHLGLADEVLHMIRRLPVDKPVRAADGDADLLRTTASAANEVVDAITFLPPTRQPGAVEHVAKRYARALGITPRDVTDALQIARQMLAGAAAPAAHDQDADGAPPA